MQAVKHILRITIQIPCGWKLKINNENPSPAIVPTERWIALCKVASIVGPHITAAHDIIVQYDLESPNL